MASVVASHTCAEGAMGGDKKKVKVEQVFF
jgi:hypothetical protein